MGRRTSPIVAPEGAPGSSTVLPGVPLPTWALPAEPVLPEPPAAERAAAPVAVAAATAVASASGPLAAPVADPEDWAAVLAPPPAAPPVSFTEPAPVDLPTKDLPPLDLPVVDLPAPDVDEPSPFDLAVPSLEPLPASDAGFPTVPMAAAYALAETDQVPHTHRHDEDEAIEAPARRRRFGRRKAADDPDPAPEAPELDAPLAGAAALDLPAPTGAPALSDLPAPLDAPVAASAPVDLAPVDLPVPVDLTEVSTGRSRRPLVVLGAIGGVAVLAAVAAFVWPGLLVSAPDDEAAAPVAPRSSAAAPKAVTLQAPVSIGALTLDTGASASSLRGLSDGAPLPGLTAPVGAVYSAAGVPSATVVAWTATAPLGPTAVTSAFAGFESTTHAAVAGIAAVPAGSLGGQMSCGSTMVSGTPASVCFWSDSATFGSVTVLSPASAAAGAQTALEIRQGVEKRG
ncbi:MAG TPA: hypothetical protein VFL59_09115 [Candidatus Nanopelagicales bacterium]|nr:hypothetical protein [Candidatus Nanopelagicales bacterium]